MLCCCVAFSPVTGRLTTGCFKNLKKSQVVVKMIFWGPKSSPTEVEFEGTVEELKKDPRMYQKTAVLRLRYAIRNL